MKKLMLSLTIALALTACGERDDQRGDPTAPMQQSEQNERRDGNVSAAPEERDSAIDHSAQPAPSADTDPEAIRSHEQEHAELQTYLNTYIRQTQADNIEQCSMFAYGQKACGGPEMYVVYSQRDMDEDAIAELNEHVARYNQLDAFIKMTRNIVSTCDITPEPEIRYENGRCIGDRSIAYR